MSKYRQQLEEDTQNLQTKKTLLKKAGETQESNLRDAVVEMKFLAFSWLDDFEKKLFEGKTVDELLNHSKYD